ncbi:MAG TPA: hypothetical protein VJ691_09830 [Vicinamibacterales bacterium]|nr:hypothetical protein [Vicinamibacterales bacterium]
MTLKDLIPPAVRQWLLAVEEWVYRATVVALSPINAALAALLARRVVPGSVLHISSMVHVPYYTVAILREHGVNADYLAVGNSPWWQKADHHFRPTRWPIASVLKEMWWVWSVVSRYDIIHSHFMVTLTRFGWEWPLLTKIGRSIVVHYRGCEIRDRGRNMQLHPAVNICQECDYDPYLCRMPVNVRRRRLAAAHGAAFLVTTPDMQDFAPAAQHVPFFIMRSDLPARRPRAAGAPFKIVHATNHPGIEGTRHIRAAVDALRARGHAIDYVELRGVTHARVLEELNDADLSIGKLKMGYYANLQIESMMAGVPTVTSVRPEFMTEALRESGFIFATLDTLEQVLEHYLTHPDALAAKQARARSSILALHDNATIAGLYRQIYAGLRPATQVRT